MPVPGPSAFVETVYNPIPEVETPNHPHPGMMDGPRGPPHHGGPRGDHHKGGPRGDHDGPMKGHKGSKGHHERMEDRQMSHHWRQEDISPEQAATAETQVVAETSLASMENKRSENMREDRHERHRYENDDDDEVRMLCFWGFLFVGIIVFAVSIKACKKAAMNRRRMAQQMHQQQQQQLYNQQVFPQPQLQPVHPQPSLQDKITYHQQEIQKIERAMAMQQQAHQAMQMMPQQPQPQAAYFNYPVYQQPIAMGRPLAEDSQYPMID